MRGAHKSERTASRTMPILASYRLDIKTIAEVEELVYQRCQRLLKQQELIRG